MNLPSSTDIDQHGATPSGILVINEPSAILKKSYELVTVSPNLTDAEGALLLERIDKILHEEGKTSASGAPTPLRGRFAYPVKHIRQGLYHSIRFIAETQSIAAISQALRLIPEILRFQIERIDLSKRPLDTVKREPTSVDTAPKGWTKREARSTEATTAEPVMSTVTPATPETEKSEERKITMEELDKKLEEILGE